MQRLEKDPRWSRELAHSQSRVQKGFPPMQSGPGVPLEGRSILGPSRFQLASSQRNRPPPRKPPEPLRRAVASCLSATHHASSEAVRTLQDYLSNSSTMDLAYTVLLEHANAERDRSPPVIAKCVAFLKRYLVRYIPKQTMLQQIDTFCASLIAECDSFTKASTASPLVQLANEHANFRQTGNSFLSSSSPGSTKAAFASGALVKSLTYVRALVARHLPNYLLQPATMANISPGLSKRSRSFKAPYVSKGMINRGSSGDDGAAESSAVLHILGLHEIEEDVDIIAGDVLKWRWMGGKRQQCWMPSPVMNHSGGIARPQVKRLYEFSDMGAALALRGSELNIHPGRTLERKSNFESLDDQLLQPSTVTTITDSSSARAHLRAIATLKRQKSQSQQVWDSHVPMSTWRRRPRPLFQYKHYSEQQPLRLSDAEIEEVISAVCVEGAVIGSNNSGIVPSLPGALPGRLPGDTADVAGSVLIKLIIDMYIADPRTASPLTFSMLEGMLSSPSVAVRVRSFDLLLNLGVHAHLLEPMQMEDQSTMEEESIGAFAHLGSMSPFTSSKRGFNLEEAFRAEERFELMRAQMEKRTVKGSANKVDGGTSQAVQGFEIWLLQILFEMLLFLAQVGEAEEEVWVAALSCLLYLICDRGRVLKQRLLGIDIRVLKILLNVSWENAWAEELHCRLVRMMSNLLYQTSVAVDGGVGPQVSFNFENLELVGGIEFICIEYARAKSVEARRNLFCIVMDYILHQLNIKLSASEKPGCKFEEVQTVVTVLTLADAPEALGIAFKHGLKNVGEGLYKSITDALYRDVDNGRLNSVLLEEFTGTIDGLIAFYIHPDEEFAELMSMTMPSEGISDVQQRRSPLQECSTDSNGVLQAWATLHALIHSPRMSCRFHGYFWLVDLLSAEMMQGGIANVLQYLPGLLASGESSDFDKMNDISSMCIRSAVQLLSGLLRSKHASVRRGFSLVLERLLVKCQLIAIESDPVQYNSHGKEAKRDGSRDVGVEIWGNEILGLMNGALWQIVSASDTDRINILQMYEVMFSQFCVKLTSSSVTEMSSNAYLRSNTTKESGDTWKQATNSSSVAAMLLRGQAAVPKVLAASIPTDVLYWPLLQLAGAATEDIALGVAVGSRGRGCTPGGTSDIRAALLVLLIGKCSVQQTAFEAVGGEEFFRSLLDDMDARVAYFTASFLLKSMMTKEPEKYQKILHSLVFRAQQSNNEKLLENPYLQIREILQLSSDWGSQLSFREA